MHGSGIEELIMAGNEAAHGAKVESSVAQWAIQFGAPVVAALEEHLENA